MAFVSFEQFGRGSPANAADINTNYQTLKSMTLGGTNFSPFAAIPESHIKFAPLGGHDHADVKLARRSVTDVQMYRSIQASAPNGTAVPYAYAQGSGVLCVSGGTSLIEWQGTNDSIQRGTIKFVETSKTQTGFLEGTIPVVIATIRHNYDIATGLPADWRAVNVMVHNVNSEGFEYQIWIHEDYSIAGSNPTWYMNYIAFGRAPGYMPEPGEIMVSGGA